MIPVQEHEFECTVNLDSTNNANGSSLQMEPPLRNSDQSMSYPHQVSKGLGIAQSSDCITTTDSQIELRDSLSHHENCHSDNKVNRRGSCQRCSSRKLAFEKVVHLRNQNTRQEDSQGYGHGVYSKEFTDCDNTLNSPPEGTENKSNLKQFLEMNSLSDEVDIDLNGESCLNDYQNGDQSTPSTVVYHRPNS